MIKREKTKIQFDLVAKHAAGIYDFNRIETLTDALRAHKINKLKYIN